MLRNGESTDFDLIQNWIQENRNNDSVTIYKRGLSKKIKELSSEQIKALMSTFEDSMTIVRGLAKLGSFTDYPPIYDFLVPQNWQTVIHQQIDNEEKLITYLRTLPTSVRMLIGMSAIKAHYQTYEFKPISAHYLGKIAYLFGSLNPIELNESIQQLNTGERMATFLLSSQLLTEGNDDFEVDHSDRLMNMLNNNWLIERINALLSNKTSLLAFVKALGDKAWLFLTARKDDTQKSNRLTLMVKTIIGSSTRSLYKKPADVEPSATEVLCGLMDTFNGHECIEFISYLKKEGKLKDIIKNPQELETVLKTLLPKTKTIKDPQDILKLFIPCVYLCEDVVVLFRQLEEGARRPFYLKNQLELKKPFESIEVDFDKLIEEAKFIPLSESQKSKPINETTLKTEIARLDPTQHAALFIENPSANNQFIAALANNTHASLLPAQALMSASPTHRKQIHALKVKHLKVTTQTDLKGELKSLTAQEKINYIIDNASAKKLYQQAIAHGNADTLITKADIAQASEQSKMRLFKIALEGYLATPQNWFLMKFSRLFSGKRTIVSEVLRTIPDDMTSTEVKTLSTDLALKHAQACAPQSSASCFTFLPTRWKIHSRNWDETKDSRLGKVISAFKPD